MLAGLFRLAQGLQDRVAKSFSKAVAARPAGRRSSGHTDVQDSSSIAAAVRLEVSLTLAPDE